MDYFDAVIEYPDGTTETIEYANQQHVEDGVLTLWQRDPYGPFRKHLGSWPLTSIKKWERRDR